MIILGITGSSGSGKTTSSNFLSKIEGVKVINADSVVKELNNPKTEYMKEIKNTFGKEYFLEDENLDRKKLASLIFQNENALNNLNNITFKYVVEEILNKIKHFSNENLKLLIIDAPLLFESELDKYCNYTLAILANKDKKIERICKRDNINKETAIARLNIQKDDSYYIKKADYVIENTGDENLLEIKIKELINKLI